MTRVAGAGLDPPQDYCAIDYVEPEHEPRGAINGPWREWSELLPQSDEPSRTPTADRPDSNSAEPLHVATKRLMNLISQDASLSFLEKCSPHMSSFIKARVLQDMLHGLNDTNGSVVNGLVVAMELGLPSLQGESPKLLESNLRAGRGASATSYNRRKVLFGGARQGQGHTITDVELLGRKWLLYDYGATIPGKPKDPIDDPFNGLLSERNQCLTIHLGSGLELCERNGPVPLAKRFSIELDN